MSAFTSLQPTSRFSKRFISVSLAKMTSTKVLSLDNLNPNVKTMEYAVRGPIPMRSLALEKELAQGINHPLKSVIKTNTGDCHAMGQVPITFVRQVLACVIYPKLMDLSDIPDDVKAHVREFLSACGGGSAGAYSISNGIELVRKNIVEFIARRDGTDFKPDPEHILLGNGASDAIRYTLKLFDNRQSNGSNKVGVMVPIPQYPLYSASCEEYNLGQIGYHLDEDNCWQLDMVELERAYEAAKSKLNIRVIVVVNPGNPTGQVLTKKNIEEIIRFAHKNRLFIFADEVYQDNIYAKGSEFHSFRKVMMSMGHPFNSLELASFHSVSKGFMGECGFRGGYVEATNMDHEVFTHFKKMISAKLCSTVIGQCAMYTYVKPPMPGDPSYELWLKEKNAVLQALKEKAILVEQAYNAIDGVTCNPVQGAMYAFPRVTIPPKAIEKAKSLGQAPDFFYTLQLLESTGVCVVPGSGFGQRDGTFHFRTTILPPTTVMRDQVSRFTDFHKKFTEKYA